MSERSGVSLSWTFAHNKEFLSVLKYGRALTAHGSKEESNEGEK